MTEFVERMNLDDLVFEDDNVSRNADAFSPGKLIGVATAGALVALSAYYLYSSLDNEKRAKVRDGVVSFVADQVQSFTAGSEAQLTSPTDSH